MWVVKLPGEPQVVGEDAEGGRVLVGQVGPKRFTVLSIPRPALLVAVAGNQARGVQVVGVHEVAVVLRLRRRVRHDADGIGHDDAVALPA